MKTNFLLFLSAVAVTFSLIAALQFTPMPWFFLVLLGMHGGVFLFIFSKRRFRRAGYAVGKYYKREYILLALYLPVLVAKLLSGIGLFPFDPTLKTVIVLAVTALSFVLSAVNAALFYRETLRKNF